MDSRVIEKEVISASSERAHEEPFHRHDSVDSHHVSFKVTHTTSGSAGVGAGYTSDTSHAPSSTFHAHDCVELQLAAMFTDAHVMFASHAAQNVSPSGNEKTESCTS